MTDDRLLTLDPKRLCRKTVELRTKLTYSPHFRLGDLVEFLPQTSGDWNASSTYRYVELQDITAGGYRWTVLRGWAGGDTTGVIVTNGCHRVRIKKGMEQHVLDLVVALSTESYATQMRAFARGSDGLAEVGTDDASEVLIPRISSAKRRKELEPFVKQLLAGYTSVRAKVDDMIEGGTLPIPVPDKRPSHSVLV